MDIFLRASRRLMILVLYLTMATLAFSLFDRDPEVNTDERTTFDKMLAGEADRPFANRLLVPMVINGLDKVFSDGLWHQYVHYRWQQSINSELRRANLEPTLAKEWYLFGWFSILCFAGFGACMFVLIQKFYSLGSLESHMWALLSLAFLPIFFGPINQVYDPTTLLFFPLAFICLCDKRFVWFYIVFVLAGINKEVSFLLIGLFAVICWDQMSRSALLLHVVLQGVLFSIIRLAILFYTAGNPGVDVENWIAYNLRFIVTPSFLLLLFLLKVVTLAFLVTKGWADKQPILKLSFLVVFVPILVLGFFGGRLVSEIRIFYEAVFLVYLLSLPTLRALLIPVEDRIRCNKVTSAMT